MAMGRKSRSLGHGVYLHGGNVLTPPNLDSSPLVLAIRIGSQERPLAMVANIKVVTQFHDPGKDYIQTNN